MIIKRSLTAVTTRRRQILNLFSRSINPKPCVITSLRSFQTIVANTSITANPKQHNNDTVDYTYNTSPFISSSIRCFQSEANFHDVADETLEIIQDALDEYLEEHLQEGDDDDIELTYASGVLTIALGKHGGTWVLNKQTPNRQIWWSSPLSGPRRFEYDTGTKTWVYTRDNLRLQDAIKQEMEELFHSELELDL